MPTRITLDDRRCPLEEAFSRKKNDQLLAKQGTKYKRAVQREALYNRIEFDEKEILTSC